MNTWTTDETTDKHMKKSSVNEWTHEQRMKQRMNTWKSHPLTDEHMKKSSVNEWTYE